MISAIKRRYRHRWQNVMLRRFQLNGRYGPIMLGDNGTPRQLGSESISFNTFNNIGRGVRVPGMPKNYEHGASFNGTNSYISTNTAWPSGVSILRNGAISMFLRMDAHPSSGAYHLITSNNATAVAYIQLAITSSGILRLVMQDNVPDADVYDSNSAVPTGRWFHAAVVWSTSGGTTTANHWIEGVKGANKTDNELNNHNPANNIVIGQRADLTNVNVYDGDMYGLAWYTSGVPDSAMYAMQEQLRAAS